MKRLILDKIRREKGYTWVSLGEATGIPFRTLQDINKRGSKRDITQVGSGSKRRLEQVAKLWGIEYTDLFEATDEANTAIDYDELDDLDEIIADMQAFEFNSIDDPSDAAKEFIELLNQTTFVFKGDFDALLAEFLQAEASDLNDIKNTLIFNFIKLCKSAGKEKAINSVVAKLTDPRFPIRIKIIKDFAIAMHQYGFKDCGDKLFEEATRRLSSLFDK